MDSRSIRYLIFRRSIRHWPTCGRSSVWVLSELQAIEVVKVKKLLKVKSGIDEVAA